MKQWRYLIFSLFYYFFSALYLHPYLSKGSSDPKVCPLFALRVLLMLYSEQPYPNNVTVYMLNSFIRLLRSNIYVCHAALTLQKWFKVMITIAVATTEADEVIALSVFVQIKGILPHKAAGRGHFDHFWSLHLV